MLTDEEVIDLWNEHMVWGDPKRGGFDDFLSAVRAAVAAERERCARLCDSAEDSTTSAREAEVCRKLAHLIRA